MRATGWTRGLLVLSLGGLLIAGCAAALLWSQNARAETQQTGTPLSNSTTSATQADHVTKFTPEQEAALVEVRKILSEASEAAQGIVIKDLESKEGKFSENNKFLVLQAMASAQARARDLGTALKTNELTKHKGALGDIAVAQAKAGNADEALKTATSLDLDVDALQAIIEALVKKGDSQTAKAVAESPKTYLKKALALAFLAQLQAKTNDLGSKETFQQALQVAQDFDKLDKQSGFHPYIGKYKALVHIARYQADAGDATGSQQTFLKARATALAIPNPKDQLNALLNIAEVQARSDDQAGSERTFAEAFRVDQGLPSKQQEIELGEMVRRQLAVGNRTAAMKTVSLILQMPSGSSPREQALGLMRRASWQLEFQEQEAARNALQAVLPQVKVLAESPSTSESDRDYIYWDIARLAGKAETFETVEEALAAIRKDERKISATKEVVELLAQTALTTERTKIIQQLTEDTQKLIRAFDAPADLTLKNMAVIQAAAGDLKSAMRTANRIGDVKHGMRERAYMEMAEVLIDKADWKSAQQVVAGVKQHWSATFEAYRKLTKAQAKAGEGKPAQMWARQQIVPVIKAFALLGAAEGIMDHFGIEQLRHSILP